MMLLIFKNLSIKMISLFQSYLYSLYEISQIVIKKIVQFIKLHVFSKINIKSIIFIIIFIIIILVSYIFEVPIFSEVPTFSFNFIFKIISIFISICYCYDYSPEFIEFGRLALVGPYPHYPILVTKEIIANVPLYKLHIYLLSPGELNICSLYEYLYIYKYVSGFHCGLQQNLIINQLIDRPVFILASTNLSHIQPLINDTAFISEALNILRRS